MNAKLYFAYGSNLNREDWARWCKKKGASPDVLKFRSVGYLPDHDICFSFRSKSRNGGVLDITPRPGQVVPGVIFEVHGDGWDRLDQKEGAPSCYEQVEVIVLDDGGHEVAVETYRVCQNRREQFVQPQQNYVDVVREGLAEFGLPTGSLGAAAQNKETPWLVDAFFAYGTLMRGESRFPILRQCGLECTLLAQAFGRLLDLGSFPGLIDLDSPSSMVQGDFIRVRNPDNAIRELDQIEGFSGFGCAGSLYRRTLCQVDVGEGRIRRAWVYYLAAADNQAAVIASGDWREHLGQRASFLSQLASAHAQSDELGVAIGIAKTLPFVFDPDSHAVIQSFLPLRAALAQGLISERKLAQESGLWTVSSA